MWEQDENEIVGYEQKSALQQLGESWQKAQKDAGFTFQKNSDSSKNANLLHLQILLCALLLGGTYIFNGFFGFEAIAQSYREYVEGSITLPNGLVSRLADGSVTALREGLQVVMARIEKVTEKSRFSDSQAQNEGKGGLQQVSFKNEKAEVPQNCTLAGYRLSDIAYLPVRGTLTSSFGFREHPITKEADFHTGLDIATRENTPVLSAFQGTVKTVGYSAISGNFVCVDHGGGVTTAYCHMKMPYVSEGQVVRRGQPLGCVGLTGVTTGYHLHFELAIGGVRVNPLQALGDSL